MLQLPENRPFFEKLPKTPKKLVLILANCVSVIDVSKKVGKILCIHYLIWF